MDTVGASSSVKVDPNDSLEVAVQRGLEESAADPLDQFQPDPVALAPELVLPDNPTGQTDSKCPENLELAAVDFESMPSTPDHSDNFKDTQELPHAAVADVSTSRASFSETPNKEVPPTQTVCKPTNESNGNQETHNLTAQDDDTASNFSSATESSADLGNADEMNSLRTQVSELQTRLLRSQEQMEALLEEKQKWLSNVRQQPQQQSKQKKTSVSSDTAAIVVKFAQVRPFYYCSHGAMFNGPLLF